MQADPDGWDWSWFEPDQPSALLIIDAQVGFVGPSTAQVPGRIESLLTSHADHFAVIVATQFVNLPGSGFRRLISWERLAESPETDLLDVVAKHADEVITKPTYGAVDQIAAILEERALSTVYVCGIDTDVCVLQNAAGLFDRGYAVSVLVDASGTNGGHEAQRAALPLLGRTIGRAQVISAP